MDEPLPAPLAQALEQANAAPNFALWGMLCEDAGCSVTVTDGQGRIVWANDRAMMDYEWHLSVRHPSGTGNQLDPIGKTFAEIIDVPAHVGTDGDPGAQSGIGHERVQVIREIARTGRAVVYESTLRGVRQRVAVRPLPSSESPRFVCFIARRLRATERVEDLVPQDARLVHLKAHDRGPLAVLSDREIQILTLVGEGMSSARIARHLHRSVRTIEGHRNAIAAKLGLAKGKASVDLVRLAIRAGLCEWPDDPDLLQARAPMPQGSHDHAPMPALAPKKLKR
jgi:DNA-binding CsgD family transcriptional regulator